MVNRYTIDPAHEMLVLTTKDGKPIGQATREECHQGEGRTHWGLLAVVKRSNGKIILAKRSQYKSVFANIWDASVATHVLPGDTPEQAAYRETKEELGIEVSFKKIGSFFYRAYDGDHAENEYCTLLVGFSDRQVRLFPDEVSQIDFLSFAELQSRIEKLPQSFSPWLKIALERYGSKLRSWHP